MLPRPVIPVVLLLLLSACASGPGFNTGGTDRSLTPGEVTGRPQLATGKSVQWGGVIMGITNLQNSTQLEVLAYPLDEDERPETGSTPLGRFILEKAGYLEPATYANGRQVTVVGTVSGTRIGRVGESDYNYPVISARQIYLWPSTTRRGGTNTFFGIGVGSGGHWGGGVGIGF